MQFFYSETTVIAVWYWSILLYVHVPALILPPVQFLCAMFGGTAMAQCGLRWQRVMQNIPCQSLRERGGHRQRERGYGPVLHQRTLRDASGVDEAKRSIWHNYCTHTVIDEHVAQQDFLTTLRTSQANFNPIEPDSMRPINSKCFYLLEIRVAHTAGRLCLYFWGPSINSARRSGAL